MIMEKTLKQLAQEASAITTEEERVNFICRNIFDLLDISTATDKELAEFASKEFGKEGKKDGN